MAGSNTVEHKLRLLIETALSEDDKKKVGKQLHDILGSAAIGFDEAETKKNITPIIRMIQKLFDKAEMKFDADKLLGMPSQEALRKVAEITASEFQTAFDRALAKSGGIKIDFGNVDLSGMTEPLERITEELVEINRKIANDTKKSVDDIDLAIKRLNKIKPKKINAKIMEDGVEKETTKEISKVEQTVGAIEKTLDAVNNPKSLTTEKGAVKALEKAASKYEESVKKGDPWEVQYQHIIDFVSKYEAMTKKIKPIMDANHSEFKELYDVLSPKAGAAKISLEHFVDVARGDELSEYKNQPWARESTLKKIEQTLKGGISVKDGGGDNKDDYTQKEQPKPQFATGDGEEKKNKKPNTKAPLSVAESDEEKATRLAKEREDAALREAERKRIEQERIAETERAAAEKRRLAEEKAIAEARKIYAEEIYRVVYAPIDEEDLSREERKSAYGGTEIWSSSSEIANTYADGEEDPVMLRGSISTDNAYIIDAKGAKWNEFDKMKVLTPTGVDSDGRVKFDEASLRSTFPDLFSRIDNKEFSQDEDIQAELYGLIKSLGYDSIITDNVIDSKNDFYEEPSTIYAVIDDRVLKVLDAFAMEEQYEDGTTIFEEEPSRENIPGYYKMPEVADIQKEAVAHQENTDAIVAETRAAEQLNDSIEEKNNIESSDDAQSEVTDINNETEAINRQNEELKENIALKSQVNEHGTDVASQTSTNLDTDGRVEFRASINTEELKGILEAITYNTKVINDQSADDNNKASVSIEPEGLKNILSAITYNVKVIQDSTSNEDNKASVSIDSEELKNVLNAITYNVKIAHDDSDKKSNKIALDDSTLESTLTKVFANILNPQTQQNDSEPKQASWALESTLQTVKGVLDNIQNNTTKFGTVEISNVDAIARSVLEGKLTEIKTVLESIDNKIAKGGVINTRGAVKQAYANAQAQNVAPNEANMFKSLQKDYENMGKLAAKFAKTENLETKAQLENIKEEIARKRKSINLTMEDNSKLRERYSIAFNAEKRLLDAAEAQREVNAQRITELREEAQLEKEAEKAWKKQVKDAQRATGINAATTAANAGDKTVLSAIGTEGISKDVENKAKELSDQIKELRNLRDNIDKMGSEASDEERESLSKQIEKVKELKKEVDGYLKIHEKYSGEGVSDLGDASNFGAVGTDQYWNNITNAIKTTSNGRATIKGLNADTGELTGTTKIAANTYAQWTATVDPLTGRLKMLRTGIKKTETLTEAIIRKTKEIFTYFSGSQMIFKVFNELKKGVQYVREIDLALTELKKVTDETEETYDKFLKTASKTAAKVGSTIKDVVGSTADWARLGSVLAKTSISPII